MGGGQTVRHSVFLGLYPDGEVARAARRAAVERGLRPAQRLHISLVGLGDGSEPPPQSWIDRVAAGASTVGRAPFLIELNTLTCFSRTRRGLWPIVLRGEDGVIGVSLLCDSILSALAAQGLGGQPPHTPHLTVSWSERPVPEQRIGPLRWVAREFVLIHSLQGAGRHEVLGRWPLKSETADASDRVGGGH